MENSFNVVPQIRSGIVVFLIIALFMAGCGIIPHRYQAAPITGQVIDKETGEPLEGVHVAVYWQLYDETSGLAALAGRVPSDVMGVSETVTDNEGYYYIPGWGPEYEVGDYLGEESPIIGFYKPGYLFRKESNSKMTLVMKNNYISEDYEYSKKKTEKGDVYTSMWDGVVIDLRKESDNVDRIISSLENVDGFIDRILHGKGCRSKFIEDLIFNYSIEAKKIKDIIKEKYPQKYRFAKFSTFQGLYDCSSYRDKEKK